MKSGIDGGPITLWYDMRTYVFLSRKQIHIELEMGVIDSIISVLPLFFCSFVRYSFNKLYAQPFLRTQKNIEFAHFNTIMLYVLCAIFNDSF